MRKLKLHLFFLLLLSLACGDKKVKDDKDTSKHMSQSQGTMTVEELGASVYNSTCVTCHGADGKLSVSGSKPLVSSTLDLEQRINIITKGSRTMLPHRYLGEEKIKAVAAYIEKFKE